MDFISKLALVLLTLAGYSMGAVLGGRDKSTTPQLLELGTVVILWVAALASRAILGRWIAISLWLVAAGLVSSGLTSLRRSKISAEATRSSTSIQKKGSLKSFWEGWKGFVREVGNYQSRILLTFFYFVAVAPFGLMVRLFGDPLRTRRLTGHSFWVTRAPASTGLDEARKQF